MYLSQGFNEAEARIKAKQDEMTRNLEAGRLYGGLGQTVGALGAKEADIGNLYRGLAGTSADIGRVYGAMAPADMQFMYNLGVSGRGYDQAVIDNQRREAMRGTEQAMFPLNYAYSALRGTPSASMTSQFTANQPTGQNNAFLSGVGAYNAIGGFGG